MADRGLAFMRWLFRHARTHVFDSWTETQHTIKLTHFKWTASRVFDNQDFQNLYHPPNLLGCFCRQNPSHPQACTATDLFAVTVGFHAHGSRQSVVFSVCLRSASVRSGAPPRRSTCQGCPLLPWLLSLTPVCACTTICSPTRKMMDVCVVACVWRLCIEQLRTCVS